MSEVTHIIQAIEEGDPRATEELLPLVYDELRRLAGHQLAQEYSTQTLQATELVDEAYLRLVGSADQHWQGRRHFFGAAAEAMRRILIERARWKGRLKHGGGWQRLDWEKADVAVEMPSDKLLAFDEALSRLKEVDAIAAELLRLRFYAGQSHQRAAEILGITRRQADGVWAFARAWLFRELNQE